MSRTEAGGPVGPLDLRWSVTPWREHRAKALFVAAFILVVAVAAWWLSGRQMIFGLMALVLLWGSVGSFYTTARYVLDEEGVAVDSPFLRRRRKWSELRSWYRDDRGATLSPFPGSHWLESYRSIRLLYGRGEADGGAIRGILNERLGPPGSVTPAGGGRPAGPLR